MAKKSLKTSRQIYLLKRYLETQPDKWPKQEVIRLAKQIKLSRSQVYKWLWDQRNFLREFQKTQQEKPKPNIYANYLGFMENLNQERSKHKECQRYRKISLRSQSQDFMISVPEKLDFAVRIRISKSTGIHFKTLLRAYGCELTRMKKERTFDTPEKKPRFAEVNEFQTVPEEKNPAKN